MFTYGSVAAWCKEGSFLTLGGRLSMFLSCGQYFLIILVAFRVVGVYLAENTTLCKVFLFPLLFRRLCFSLNWNLFVIDFTKVRE